MQIFNALKQSWGKLDESWRFAISAFVIARTFYAIWSGIILLIQPVAVHYVNADKGPAALFLSLYTLQQHTYLNEINGTSLHFRSASQTTVSDLETGSIWDINTGEALEGHFKGSTLIPANPPPDMFPYYKTKPYHNAWLGVWQRFDANWYTTIAEYGYGSIPGDDHFPPLYPLLIRLVTSFTGNAFLAGLIISHLATLFAIKLLVDLFNQWSNKVIGQDIVFYFLIYPTSFFLFSAYTEAPFLVVALLALHAMKKSKWAWAGFWTFCAILFRLQGVALIPVMLYLSWEDKPFLRKPSQWLGLITAGSGFLSYIYLRSIEIAGNALPFSEANWHAKLVPPWVTYLYAVQTLFSGKFNHIDFLNWATATLFLILFITGWKKTPLEYNIYVLASLIIILVRVVQNQPLISMSRYSLALFPSFYLFSGLQNRPFWRRIVIYSSLLLNLFLSAEFFGWGFVA